MKETVSELLQSALAALQSDGTLPADQSFTPQVGNTKDKSHGDYACNIALVASKAAGCPRGNWPRRWWQPCRKIPL